MDGLEELDRLEGEPNFKLSDELNFKLSEFIGDSCLFGDHCVVCKLGEVCVFCKLGELGELAELGELCVFSEFIVFGTKFNVAGLVGVLFELGDAALIYFAISCDVELSSSSSSSSP